MRTIWLAALCALSLAGCREADGPMGGTSGGVLFVASDPSGARISVDGKSTGRVTPDTIRGVAGLRSLRVQLDTAGVTYGYSGQVVVSGTQVTSVYGPLMAQCLDAASVCAKPYHDEHVVGNLRFGTNALGPVFLEDGSGGGLHWPATTSNSYLSTGTPVFGALLNGQPVALGVYDTDFFAGRPAPRVELGTGNSFVLTQSTWIVPPASVNAPRGIEIVERVATSADLTGAGPVLLIELTFRNITAEPLYRTIDNLPGAGLTYEDAYLGLVLDPDIGDAEDDWVSYDEPRATVFAYDAAFQEQGFGSSQSAPALVGLKVMSAPAGTRVLLNSYVNTGGTARDWRAGTFSQSNGYGMLSGTAIYVPDHVHTRIGHLPSSLGDVRILASVGPLRLAPGDAATVLFAVALAAPTAGTYTSGQTVAPGEATDESRSLFQIASGLRARLAAADQLRPLLGQ